MDNKNKKILTTSSQGDIYNNLLAIAGKYTDIQNEDFLRTGAMGYITESMAMMIRNSSFHKTMLYNESFLNTARMPNSVYNWAKMFNIQVDTARPAQTEIMITIPVEDIARHLVSAKDGRFRKYGSDISAFGDRGIIVIDRETPFIVGELTFHMEKSVVIYERVKGIYGVRYIGSEKPTTTYFRPASKDIKSAVTQTGNTNYLSFVVRAYQYEIIKSTKQIISSSFIDTKIHKFPFTDQFVGSRLFYQTGRSEPVEITLKHSSIDNLLQTQDSMFGYYNIVDREYLEIVFSSEVGGFMPVANSLLHSDIYVTKGQKGNINYSGDVTFMPKEEYLRTLPVMAKLYSDTSQGGIDAPGIENIKQKIINAISTRDVIVTESDLNNYFLTLTSLLGTINSGEIKFIKKRDDILKRLFSSFILLRDGNTLNEEGVVVPASSRTSAVIPTNTLDVFVKIPEGKEINPSISPGSKVVRYENDYGQTFFVQDNDSELDDYYIVPFYTYVNLHPFKKVKYIYNLTSDSSPLIIEGEVKSNGTNMIIPSTIEVVRSIDPAQKGQPEKFYTINFVVNTNFDLKNSTTSQDYFTLNMYNKLSSTIPEASFLIDSENYAINEIEFDGGTYTFAIEITLPVSIDDEFGFKKQSNNYGSFIYLNNNGVNNGEQTVPVSSDVLIELKIENLTSSPITMTMRSSEHLTLFQNLDDLMFSDIVTNKYTEFTVVDYLDTDSLPEPYTSVTVDGSDAVISFTDGSNEEVKVYTNRPTSEEMIRDGITESEKVPGHYHIVVKQGDVINLLVFVSDRPVDSVMLKDVPLIHSSFFNSKSVSSEHDAYLNLIKQIFVYVKMLKENLGKLESNTFFDLKFFNTYGDAKYYTSESTSIKLEMEVYVKNKTKALELQIKDYVRMLVDFTNTNRFMDVSFIITSLRNAFPEIKYITFLSLNGTLNQEISSRTEGPEYTPEYINIQPKDLDLIKVIETR